MSIRKPIFDAIKAARAGEPFSMAEVAAIDALLTSLRVPSDGAKGRAISPEGIALIKRFEGLKLRAYPDPGTGGKPWTIGIGTTVYPSGQAVGPGDVITEAQAEEYLRHDLARFEAAVNRLAPQTTQAQFDALVSFTYNLGETNLAKSTLLKLHKARDHAGAAREFGKWTLAAGKQLPGLVKRRAAEAALYRKDQA